MSFSSLMNTEADFYRHSDVIAGTTPLSAQVVIENQLSTSAALEVQISGCSIGSGSMLARGVVAGVTTEELFKFTQNDFLVGTVEFDSLVGVTTAGFTGEAEIGNVQILARSLTGEPVKQYVLVYSNTGVRISTSHRLTQIGTPGVIQEGTFRLFSPADLTLEINDKMITEDNRTYFLTKDPMPIRGIQDVHHYETEIREDV